MKIRRYVGKNAQEAMLKVKMDLGNEAVILNTRKVKQKGFFKFFSKPLVEVLAAIDENTTPIKVKPPEPSAVVSGGAPVAVEKKENMVELKTKVADMETLLNKIYERMQNLHQGPDISSEGDNCKNSRLYELFYENLIKNEVDVDIAKDILGQVKEKQGESAGVNDIASHMGSLVSNIMGKPEPVSLREDGKPTVMIFVGPTGVGKTTTLAKIAANYSLNHKKSVGLISADTYRIAAVEQLKTYAEILGMPVSVIYSPDEVQDAINGYSDKDIILVDTAGRSDKNKAHFEELKSLVTATKADEVFLVLSVTTGSRICREIIKSYSFLENYKLIFTKLDETPVTGMILNVKYLTGKNLCFVTNGQSVPDDIETANVDKLIKSMLGSMS